MKSMRKPLLLLAALAVLVSVTVYATVAYFTDTAEVTNTFSVGKVSITLDEEIVNPDGTEADGNSMADNRTPSGNNYHLVPGKIYMKDPTMTVKAGSEPSYVRMFVTINNISEIKAMLPGFLPENHQYGWDKNVWSCYGTSENTAADTMVLEFRYNGIVPASSADQKLAPLFTNFVVPGELTGPQLNQLLEGYGDPARPATQKAFEIVIQGQAIQATGFGNEAAAWSAFDAQHGSNGPV